MPTGLYTRWDLDSESDKFKPRQNKTRSFENMVMSYFQPVRLHCKMECFYRIGTQTKIDAYSVDGFCGQCNTVFEAMGCFYEFFVYVKKLIFLSLKRKFREAIKRESQTNYENNTYKQRVMTSLSFTNVIEGNCTRQIILLNSICGVFHLQNASQRRRNFRKYQTWKSISFCVILKYPRISEKPLPTFHPSSRIFMLIEMTLVRLRKNMPRKRDIWLSLGFC